MKEFRFGEVLQLLHTKRIVSEIEHKQVGTDPHWQRHIRQAAISELVNKIQESAINSAVTHPSPESHIRDVTYHFTVALCVDKEVTKSFDDQFKQAFKEGMIVAREQLLQEIGYRFLAHPPGNAAAAKLMILRVFEEYKP